MNKTLKVLKDAQSLSIAERKELIKLLVDSLNTSSQLEELTIKKKWKGIGSVKLGKNLDQINIRDFAHD